MATRLSEVISTSPQVVATASLSVDTAGEGLTEITEHVRHFLDRCEAGEGVLFLYLRHTSASLLVQENADSDVRTDLITALRRLAPDNTGWVHDTEGPDDMPAHIKAMLTGISLHVPVAAGAMMLGTWQGIYLVEHRRQPHRREVILQFAGRGR